MNSFNSYQFPMALTVLGKGGILAGGMRNDMAYLNS